MPNLGVQLNLTTHETWLIALFSSFATDKDDGSRKALGQNPLDHIYAVFTWWGDGHPDNANTPHDLKLQPFQRVQDAHAFFDAAEGVQFLLPADVRQGYDICLRWG